MKDLQRIMIIGGNGSGKTTFSIELAEKLDLPLVHLDVLYWRDNWGHATSEEFDELLLQEINQPKWIMDGNFNRTLPMRLNYCDTVIYFDFSTLKCLYGVVTRVIEMLQNAKDVRVIILKNRRQVKDFLKVIGRNYDNI